MEYVIIGTMVAILVSAVARRGRRPSSRRTWRTSASDFTTSDGGASSLDPMMFTAADPAHASMFGHALDSGGIGHASHCHGDTSSSFSHYSSCDSSSSSGFDSGGGSHHH
jgi:hypothetical protein